ncbi:MAG: D-aminoacyl-tRNA deacylase [Candidatus Micrarchaeia archaeon]
MGIRIVYSREDPAATNILRHIEQIGTCSFPIECIDGSALEFCARHTHDVHICLSKHRSVKRVPALTCHHTGNWTAEALYGGRPHEVCIAAPSVATALARSISARIGTVGGYEFSLEVTHHGPTGNFPIVFAEIGSCEEDWGNQSAGLAIAEAICSLEPCEEGEVVMGAGGPHYAPNFTKLIGSYRIGHIIPKYAVDGLEYETFAMGITRSVDSVGKVLIDWKGLDGPQRDKITKFCNEFGIEHIKYK